MEHFGPRKQKGFIERNYLGKWIIAHIQGDTTSYAGRVHKFEDGFMLLNPHNGSEWDAEKGLTLRLVDDDESLVVGAILTIQPISKDYLEQYNSYQNTHKDIKSNGSVPKKKEE